MKRRISVVGLAVGLALVVPLSAASAQAGADHPAANETTTPIVVDASAIAWEAGPPSLPAGAEFAVLEGHPAQPGPLTLRLRFPANYEVPPHWHSVLEHVTVFEGTLHVGMGETMDKSGGVALSAGDFGVLPVEMTHFAWTESPVVFQLHSVGPWDITYVDPNDDPRQR